MKRKFTVVLLALAAALLLGLSVFFVACEGGTESGGQNTEQGGGNEGETGEEGGTEQGSGNEGETGGETGDGGETGEEGDGEGETGEEGDGEGETGEEGGGEGETGNEKPTPVPDVSDKLVFTLNDEGTAYSVTRMDISAAGSVTIPATYNGLPVTSIGSSAFYNCSTLTEITIPEGVTSIGLNAFAYCSGLTEITIPEGVTSIGSQAFRDCSNLTEINYNAAAVPDLIWNSTVFYNAGSNSEGCTVTFGESVKNIPANLFVDANITSVTIGSNVESIGSQAFRDCSNLTEINYNAAAVADLTYSSNVFYNAGSDSDGITVIFGESVKSIPVYLFYTNSSSYFPNLVSVTIGSNVESIGSYAFYNCSGLVSVTIPESATSIGSSAFYGCYKLIEVYNKSALDITAGSRGNGYVAYYAKHVYTQEGGSWFTDTAEGYRFFYDGNKGYLMGYYGAETALTLPTGFTAYDGTEVTKYEIYEFAFFKYNSLTDITVSESVTSIGSQAFSGCSNLTKITIPDVVTSIGYRMFSGCSSLTEITIPASVTSIDSYAFSGCSSLTEITIPEGVTSIDSYAFSGCSSLMEITIPEGVTSIGRYAFSGCSSLMLVTIPASVTSIGKAAFEDCSSLTSVTIPEGVTSIGEAAFEDCSGLVSVTIPESVTSIGEAAFKDCSSLTSVTIPDSVTGIGRTAFSGCSSLMLVTIPEGVTSIDPFAFYNCSSLMSVTIPESATSIGSSAFYGCYKLIEVYNKSALDITAGSRGNGYVAYYAKHVYTQEGGSWFTDTAEGYRFFYDGNKGYLMGYSGTETALTLPTGFTAYDGTEVSEYEIYAYALGGYSELTSVTIPEGVVSIGSGAFYGCYKLIEVYNKSALDITAGSRGNGYVAYYAKHVYTQEGGSWFTDTAEGYRFFYDGNKGYLMGYSGTETALTLPTGFTAYDGTEVSEYEIYAYALGGYSELTSVTIPEGVVSIGELAFYNCSGLTSVTIGSNVESIGSYAFSSCSNLTSVTFKNTKGWRLLGDPTATSGTSLSSSSLANPSTAATYLKSAYSGFYWHRS